MIPAGFEPHTRHSPLTEPWEPLFARETDDAIQLTLEIREAHCNARGFAHGGLISALADNAMGLSVVRLAPRKSSAEKISAVTVTLTLDFIDSAKLGDWIEFQPSVLKVGRTLSFVSCRIVSGEQLVARASATFRMLVSAG